MILGWDVVDTQAFTPGVRQLTKEYLIFYISLFSKF